MDRTPERVPRDTLSERIEGMSLPQAKRYADFIRAGDPDGPIPCWGAIAERFEEEFTRNADRKALWNILVEAEDRRPLLLFLHVNRGRPGVMAKVLEDVNRLSVPLQRALVSLDEVASEVPKHIHQLDPAARQLFEAGPEPRKREREMFEERVARLRAFRFFVPDSFDPASEPGEARTSATNPTISGGSPVVTDRVAPVVVADNPDPGDGDR